LSTATQRDESVPSPAVTPTVPPEQPPYPSAGYAWYVVGVLMIVYVVSFIDRQVIFLLVEPIKRDLQISDSQVSLLQGLSFAIFYTLLGIPFGRLADRYSRRWIIAAGVFVWSLFAAACGLARDFWQLFLARMGVGVGEAALSPAAYSLMTDYFPPEKLGRAFSVYGMGITLGSGLAFVVGGFVIMFVSGEGATVTLPLFGEIRAWQFVFIVTGLPGIPLALLMLTVREPVRRGLLAAKAALNAPAPRQVPFSEVVGFIAQRRRVFVPHFLGFAVLALAGYGTVAWFPTMMVRTHGLSPAEVGKIFGLILMISATAGLYAAGRLADWLTARGYADAPMRVSLGIALVGLPFGLAVPLLPEPWMIWSALIVSSFVASSWAGVSAAAVAMVTPNQMRGQVSAIYLFVVNIIGLGFGPTAVALLTDFLYGDPALVRYSLSTLALLTGPLAAFLFWRVLAPFRQARAEAAAWAGR